MLFAHVADLKNNPAVGEFVNCVHRSLFLFIIISLMMLSATFLVVADRKANAGACSGAVVTRSPHNLETRVRSQTRGASQLWNFRGLSPARWDWLIPPASGFESRMFVRPIHAPPGSLSRPVSGETTRTLNINNRN